MLSFENSQDMDSTLDTMRLIGDRGDYLQQELLPALLRGDWEELDKMVVYQDQKRPSCLARIYGRLEILTTKGVGSRT